MSSVVFFSASSILVCSVSANSLVMSNCVCLTAISSRITPKALSVVLPRSALTRSWFSCVSSASFVSFAVPLRIALARAT